MDSMGMDISLNSLSNNEIKTNKEHELINYLYQIQTKFMEQIEKINIKNEILLDENAKFKNENKILNEKLELSNNTYYNDLVKTQECLKVQLETNDKLLKIIKENENKIFYSRYLKYYL